MLLAIAARRGMNVEKLSMPGFAAFGALGGLMVSFGPTLMVGVGFGDFKEPYTACGVTSSLMGPLALGGAVTAAGSLVLARRASRRESLAHGVEAAELAVGSGSLDSLITAVPQPKGAGSAGDDSPQVARPN